MRFSRPLALLSTFCLEKAGLSPVHMNTIRLCNKRPGGQLQQSAMLYTALSVIRSSTLASCTLTTVSVPHLPNLVRNLPQRTPGCWQTA